jgi:hypothetical protein
LSFAGKTQIAYAQALTKAKAKVRIDISRSEHPQHRSLEEDGCASAHLKKFQTILI